MVVRVGVRGEITQCYILSCDNHFEKMEWSDEKRMHSSLRELAVGSSVTWAVYQLMVIDGINAMFPFKTTRVFTRRDAGTIVSTVTIAADNDYETHKAQYVGPSPSKPVKQGNVLAGRAGPTEVIVRIEDLPKQEGKDQGGKKRELLQEGVDNGSRP